MKPTLIEQTSKKLKMHYGLAMLLTLSFFVLSVISGMRCPTWLWIMCIVCFGLSLIYAIVIKVMIWWHHE
jgi:hypothetical protein